jgi:FAD/FMN-containing dehydrogenase
MLIGMAKANGARSDARLQEEKHLRFWLAVSNIDASLAERDADLVKAKLNYPISEWRGIVESVKDTLSDADLDYTLQVHAGNGICLLRLLVSRNDVEAMDRGMRAMNSLLARCREKGGNLVIEDAPTEVKDRLKIWGEAGSDFVVMKRIKEQIDPSGIMSPGRFVGGL